MPSEEASGAPVLSEGASTPEVGAAMASGAKNASIPREANPKQVANMAELELEFVSRFVMVSFLGAKSLSPDIEKGIRLDIKQKTLLYEPVSTHAW